MRAERIYEATEEDREALQWNICTLAGHLEWLAMGGDDEMTIEELNEEYNETEKELHELEKVMSLIEEATV